MNANLLYPSPKSQQGVWKDDAVWIPSCPKQRVKEPKSLYTSKIKNPSKVTTGFGSPAEFQDK